MPRFLSSSPPYIRRLQREVEAEMAWAEQWAELAELEPWAAAVDASPEAASSNQRGSTTERRENTAATGSGGHASAPGQASTSDAVNEQPDPETSPRGPALYDSDEDLEPNLTQFFRNFLIANAAGLQNDYESYVPQDDNEAEILEFIRDYVAQGGTVAEALAPILLNWSVDDDGNILYGDDNVITDDRFTSLAA